MIHNHQKRSAILFRLTFFFILFAFSTLFAAAQTPYRGDSTTLQPKSAIAPKGYMHTDYLYKNPALFSGGLNPFGAGIRVNTSPPPYAPVNIQTAYNIPATGGGDAIAIVDAFDLSTALGDFNTFASQFGLPQESSSNVLASTNQVFQVVYASGSQPGSSVPSGWNIEEALDIEWSHSLAPHAKIYLVEANTNSGTDLYAADQVAAALPGVKEVSNSWGGGEYSGENTEDSTWVYSGVAFFFSSGDQAVQEFPSESVNTVAVGGTSLNMNWNGSGTNWDGTAYSNYVSETGWSGSGGGPSAYESRPSFQNPVANTVGSVRGAPDCSAVADPNTGVYVYTTSGGGSWYEVGGTSLACPVTAAITNSREYQLNNFATSSQIEELRIYNNAMGSFYRDVTSGDTANENTGVGWDFVTGIGTPNGLLAPWSSNGANAPGNSDGIGSGATEQLRWTGPAGTVGSPLPNTGQPAIGANNAVYWSLGKLYAVDGGTGNTLWTDGGPFYLAPALDSFGNLFAVTGDALDSVSSSSGSNNWSFTAGDTDSSSAPVVGTGDVVYFGDNDGDMYAINGQTGSKIWSESANSAVTTPVLDPYGNVYFVSESGTLYSLDAATGSTNWTATVGATTLSPALGPNQMVYVAASDGQLYAVNTISQSSSAIYTNTHDFVGAPAVGANGNVYVMDAKPELCAFSSTGSLLWTANVGTSDNTPAIGADGTVYVGNNLAVVSSVNGSTGAINWTQSIGGFALSASPAIGADGTVYVASDQSYYVAVGTNAFSSVSAGSTINGGSSETGTVTLSETPLESLEANLSSSDTSALQVAAHASFSAGQTQATFNITTSAVSSPVIVTITASYSSSSVTTTLTVNPNGVSGFATEPSTVQGGQNSGLFITLAGPAGPTGNTISLSSGNACVTVPGTVTVPAGDTTYSHGFTTSPVTTSKLVTITAMFNGNQAQTTITVNPAALNKLVISPTSVTGGVSSTVGVELASIAGTGGDVVSLSSNSSAAAVPSTVTVLQGATEVTQAITTSVVSTPQTATITATFNGAQLQATLTVEPHGLTDFSVSPGTVAPGNSVTGKITLSGIAGSSGGGNVVSLSDGSSPAITIPSTVTVSGGQTSMTFPITANAVASRTTVTITASFNGKSLQANLTVVPLTVSTFYATPASVSGGANASVVVGLSAPSPGGTAVGLSSNNGAVSVPPTVTVSSGATSATQPITTSAVSTTQNVTLTASYNGNQTNTTLTVQPHGLTDLSLSPSAVVGGKTVTLSVSLSGVAGSPNGNVISLQSNNSALPVPGTVTVPALQSSTSIPLTSTAVATQTKVTVTASFNGKSIQSSVMVDP